ncbi:serine hydrolase [Pedobacter deserti]|uniref:serine hydrolase n=1 Tax=Pedobacter deserti TaxID=2817382 RepID=UPI00210C0FEE|nr:serine hydrolase [Pedobacter sp. SYSU D00382]
MIRKSIYIGFLLVCPLLTTARQPALQELDAFIARQVKDYKMPGLAIGIIKNKKLLFKKGYGLTDLATGQPVTTQTVFPISSCTKAFTATALAMLVAENKLSWDDKVIKHLPDFALSDPWITKELTITDLLSHRTGLATFDGDLLFYGTNYTRKQIVDKMRFSPIRNEFRAEMGYNNIMYVAAGLVVEAVSGQSWENFIHSRIFDQLNMKESYTDRQWLKPGSNFALPHIRNKPIATVSMVNTAPAGGIDASTDDMLKWLELWLSDGMAGDKRLINLQDIATMTSLKVMTSADGDEGYGLGWFIRYENGKKIVHHSGGMPGYQSGVVLYPETGSGIVILTNKISGINDELIAVIQEYLEKPDMFNWKSADARMTSKGVVYDWDKARKEISASRSDVAGFKEYLGTYVDAVYGGAVMRYENGKPFLELLPAKGLFSGFLQSDGKDTMDVVFKDPFISPGHVIFDRDVNGKIKGFKLDIDSDDFLFGDLDFKKHDNVKHCKRLPGNGS